MILAAQPAGEKVASLAAGAQHTLALTAHGEVYSWGSSQNGRLGHGRQAGGLGFLGMSAPRPEFKPRLIRALEALRISQVRCKWARRGTGLAKRAAGLAGLCRAPCKRRAQ